MSWGIGQTVNSAPLMSILAPVMYDEAGDYFRSIGLIGDSVAP